MRQLRVISRKIQHCTKRRDALKVPKTPGSHRDAVTYCCAGGCGDKYFFMLDYGSVRCMDLSTIVKQLRCDCASRIKPKTTPLTLTVIMILPAEYFTEPR
jgi:hypothetical protein